MGAEIDLRYQSISAWVNSGVGAIRKFVDVWRTHIFVVGAEPVGHTFSESVSATVEVGCRWTENVGLDPDGWAGVTESCADGGAWEDFADER